MNNIEGIEFIEDHKGNTRYVQIDLDLFDDDSLLFDFLDGEEVLASKGEPMISLEEFNRICDKRIEEKILEEV
ncbi:MAG: hypothetical protein LBF08_06055 [Dysgonamonadaceae bacterium]|jgi:hypothetical protein|nr:hypothetical protein [Dysgonamonadaceae bacterium]